MKGISAITHEFHREKVDDDGSNLCTAFRYVNGTLNTSDNKCLRSLVAGYILNKKEWHPSVLESNTKYKTIKDYCDRIKKGNLPGGKFELQALAMIGCLVVSVVSMTKTDQGNVNIKILNYGEHEESFKECVYILYDEENKQYDPLYVINKEDPRERLTIFQRDDGVVSELLEKFIQEELHGFHNIVDVNELPTETDLFNETDQIFNMIVPTATTNLIDTIVSFPNNDQQLPISIQNKYFELNKPTKSSKIGTDQVSTFNNNNSESKTIDNILLTGHFFSESVPSINQQATTDDPMVSNQDQTIKMRFEIDTALKFRGRTKHEYKPKNPLNRNREPSKPYSPRHFADRNGKHALNLLIPETYLSPNAEHDLEICLVTPEINGCIYIHPYFKFQVHPTDKQIPDENPIYIPFDMTELKDYSEGIKQYQLRLVVIMHTNPELMETEQPLQTFSLLNNGLPITATYNRHDAFKNAYHLHDVRFAVTLRKKEPGEIAFRRYDDIQYISQISTEQKKYKSSKK